MRRVYYSGYQPVCGEELAPPASALRQHRLYQADWLLRFYGFRFGELPFGERGSLPAELDPKAAWALLHPDRFPLEVNRAGYEDLLRVPGIGPVSARRIVALRATCTFRDLKELSRLGAATRRARQFLLLDGRYLGNRALANHPIAVQDVDPVQLSLWDHRETSAEALAV
jgi:predicted DNA-binding helix-hairpin-helix protein